MSPQTRKNQPQRVRVTKTVRIDAGRNSAQKKIFAIVSQPIPTSMDDKTIRCVVIFDNHPDTLRLILQAGVDVTADDFAVRRDKLISFVSGSVLILMCAAAVFWAFLS